MSSFFSPTRELFFKIRSMDWIVFFSSVVLVFLGLAAIYSVDLSRDATDLTNLKKQFFALLLALVLACVVMGSNYQFLEHYRVVFYVFGLVMLLGVFLFGHTIRGARGWYVLGSFSFQPVEFMKAAMIVMLAAYFSRRARRAFGWKEFIGSALYVIPPVFLVLLQPDFGSAAVLIGIWFALAFFAGMPWRTIVLLFAVAGVLFAFAWFVLFAPYQKARIETFFHPSADPLGQGYNVQQAVIAIGAGGWFGRGLGFGTQSQLKFLPESQTDFIFAVIAEELGFLGVGLLLGAFVCLFWRLARLVSAARDNFTVYLLLGIASTFFLHVLVNMGMNLGMIPVTGIGLPLVSYGGSSLIFFLFLVAVVESVAMRSVRTMYQH